MPCCFLVSLGITVWHGNMDYGGVQRLDQQIAAFEIDHSSLMRERITSAIIAMSLSTLVHVNVWVMVMDAVVVPSTLC